MHASLAHTRVPSLAQDDRRKPSRSGMNHGRTEAQGRCELEERKARQWECGKWLSRFSERGGGMKERRQPPGKNAGRKFGKRRVLW